MKTDTIKKLNFNKITISDFEMSKITGGTVATRPDSLYINAAEILGDTLLK